MLKFYSFLLLISFLFLFSCQEDKPTATPNAALTPTDILIIGTGEEGLMDGNKGMAKFNHPIRLTHYGASAVLVADIYNHAVRSVSNQGAVTTIIGHPDQKGYLDTTINNAKLNGPHGVAINSKGDIVIGEASNHTLRLLSRTATETQTIAGQAGQTGYVDGAKDSTLFNSPHGIAFNHSDELFIADIGNSVVRKLSTDNLLSTYLKNNADSEISLVYPIDLIVDADDNLWIVDGGSHKIIKCDTAKNLSVPFPDLVLKTPHGITQISKDTFAVAEMKANRIIGLDMKNKTTFTLIDSTSFPDNITPLNSPADVLFHAGRLWIADLKNNRIVVVKF